MNLTSASIIEWAAKVAKPPASGMVRLTSWYPAIDIMLNRQFSWSQIYAALIEQKVTVQPTLKGFTSAAGRGVKRYRAREKARLEDGNARRKDGDADVRESGYE